MSASNRATRYPSRARATATFAVTVDLPTPPLAEAIATLNRTSGIGSGRSAIRALLLCLRSFGRRPGAGPGQRRLRAAGGLAPQKRRLVRVGVDGGRLVDAQ